MVKVDLITGFLGSGKTTFIKKYVKFLLGREERIGILENDYGAINVDMMLLADLKKENVGLEMVAGGCDYDCHKRRFKTKLLTMALLGYDRVIVEPSGVFDVDEFYDLLQEDELYNRYQIDNVITIVDPLLCLSLSENSRSMFASQIATSGKVVFSFVKNCDEKKIYEAAETINESLKAIQCTRTFELGKNILAKDWDQLTAEDYKSILTSGYQETRYIKNIQMNETGFESLFFMNLKMNKEELEKSIQKMWKDDSTGNVIRVKGFIQDETEWIEINSTKDVLKMEKISEGQSLVIVIGEKLNLEKLTAYYPSEYSTSSVLETSQKATILS